MRNEIKYFLENTKDEEIIFFIFGNSSKAGIDHILDMLRNCNQETQDRWQTTYSIMYLKNK